MKNVLIQTLGLLVFFVSLSNASDLSRVEQEIEARFATQKARVHILYEEGRSLHFAGKFQASIDKLIEVQDTLDVPSVNFYLARNYHSIGDYQKASEYYRKVILLYAKEGFSKDDTYLRVAYVHWLAVAFETKDCVLVADLLSMTPLFYMK